MQSTRSVRLKVTVDGDGVVKARTPRSVPPGEYDAVIEVPAVEPDVTQMTPREFMDHVLIRAACRPDQIPLRREDMYDDGR
jgi:hypothetical protein